MNQRNIFIILNVCNILCVRFPWKNMGASVSLFYDAGTENARDVTHRSLFGGIVGHYCYEKDTH